MPFQFLCPQGHLLQGDESQIGLQTQCPLCGVVFVIPPAPSQAAPQYPQPQQQFPQQPYSQQPFPQQQFGQPQYPAYGQPQYPQPQYPQPQFPYQQYPDQQAGGFPGPQSPGGFGPREAYPRQAYPQEAHQDAGPGYPSFEESEAAAKPASEPAAGASADVGSELGADLEHSPGSDASIEPACLHIPCPNGHELETPVDMLGQEVLCPHCGAQFLLREEDSVEHQERLEALDSQRAHAWFNWAIAAAVIVIVSLLAMVVVAMRG